MAQLFANAARGNLSAGILSTDTTITIGSGGSAFPAISGSDWFKAVLQDTSGIEIVYVTAHTADSNSFTVTRGQEGTTARAFGLNSVFGLRLTAGDMTSLTTTASVAAVRQPINSTPASGATGVVETPTLTGNTYYSLYGIAQNGAQFQVSTSSTFATITHDSGTLGAVTSYTLPAAVLAASTVYYWRCRYRDSENVWSAWSAGTSFTTATVSNSYIATPTATPAIGAALEGGFYAGMIWNELVQSVTSTTISTGSKTFTVPSMTGAAIVYAGQTLEVRSRANPANKMVGTVTGAAGTSLTINITSVGGSGTFTDWSVMATYRVIVAPKASGENASIAYKNANTAAPAATGTLTEGRAATLAMVAADTSIVYPAAWWCYNLNIGGKTDWYLPARDELELCWRNLKPVTDANYTTADRPTAATPNYANLGSYGDTAAAHGTNNNSSPVGAAYTTSVPGQTAATAFQTGGTEAFTYGTSNYWSSTEYSASAAWLQYWHSGGPGSQSIVSKSVAGRVRAVRRSII